MAVLTHKPKVTEESVRKRTDRVVIYYLVKSLKRIRNNDQSHRQDEICLQSLSSSSEIKNEIVTSGEVAPCA